MLVSGHELLVQTEEVGVTAHHAETTPSETFQIRSVKRNKFIQGGFVGWGNLHHANAKFRRKKIPLVAQ